MSPSHSLTVYLDSLVYFNPLFDARRSRIGDSYLEINYLNSFLGNVRNAPKETKWKVVICFIFLSLSFVLFTLDISALFNN